ncbi:MAG: glutathione S-transferase C-terminal domain-containing protein [Paracoccus sp. (in: a-proteobacteria)]|uniref:glutathione S-transferase C-terminal domain-containing protein n=1 Tax=Paracoccus sp. TaxID=267 RepID=UPI0026DEE4A1|nr:glutathione S-transferase C-terminal domain-containing protein [Paracoccus sp. (in: a-proteobacteria)]MDO5620621.1 glutathione S-transferase C-terminal domain-containing protein [Paracoccus sp. (in: a-proteobacteria)]
MARLNDALQNRPFLLGDRISAADLLIASPFAWFDMPAPARVADWAERVNGWQAGD